MRKFLVFLVFHGLFFVSFSFAGEADVVKVDINKGEESVYSFSVTVYHKDTGWNHYANKWDIVDEKGIILATRILYHPHIDEQPFTRSLSGVKIPVNIKTVIIRAHDLVHKYGGKELSNQLPQ